jgi:hypothetical protein
MPLRPLFGSVVLVWGHLRGNIPISDFVLTLVEHLAFPFKQSFVCKVYENSFELKFSSHDGATEEGV